MRSGPGAARTILLFHIISARPSKQPLRVRTPIHNMGLCSRPKEDPNAWKQFGPTRAIEPWHWQPGILGGGLRGGGPGRSPFWRTLEESCKGLGSVTLKINTQQTHDLRIRLL